ncbi:MAG: hypothetical protein ACOY4D_06245 [Pseudomonadota bacterium]
MFYTIKDKINRRIFAAKCGGILDTAPLVSWPESNLTVISQLQHKDLLMYLLAVKSFTRHIGVKDIHVLDDGSLDAEDIAVLRHHIPFLNLRSIADFRNPHCPQGGTWERLIAISELVKKSYVIQLDSDTLTVGGIDEVARCVADGIGFSIGTWDNQQSEKMQERCATAKSLKPGLDTHVQLVAEANFDKLSDYENLNYIRGCSGFAGFPQGSFSIDFMEKISQEMQAAIGDKWAAWGSEQVMSNIVVANIASAVVLPHPKYCASNKLKEGAGTAFIHFIGSHRFNDGIYAGMGMAIIDELCES